MLMLIYDDTLCTQEIEDEMVRIASRLRKLCPRGSDGLHHTRSTGQNAEEQGHELSFSIQLNFQR